MSFKEGMNSAYHKDAWGLAEETNGFRNIYYIRVEISIVIKIVCHEKTFYRSELKKKIFVNKIFLLIWFKNREGLPLQE